MSCLLQVSRTPRSHGVRGVEPEGRRRRAPEKAGERRRRGRVSPGAPGAEERRPRPGAWWAPGQEHRGADVGSESARRRDGNARVGGGAEAEAEDGRGTARCVERGWCWYSA
jgi:hypothetical protein